MLRTNAFRLAVVALAGQACAAGDQPGDPEAHQVAAVSAPEAVQAAKVDSAALARVLSRSPASVHRQMAETARDPDGELVSADPHTQRLIDSMYAASRAASDAGDPVAPTGNPWSEPLQVGLVDNDQLPMGTAVVVRRPPPTPSDLVLLRDGDARPARLSAALRALAGIRARDGAVAGRSQRVTIELRVSDAVQEPARWGDYLSHLLRELRHAPPVSIPGVGLARVITIEQLGR